MPRTAGISTPKYRKHRPSGQAVVTITGRTFYLGPHGTKASRVEYDRLISEWLAGGRALPQQIDQHDLTITELVASYKRFADAYYVKNGQPTGAIHGIKVALRWLRQSYGHTLAHDFGPLALAALRQRIIDGGACRRYANDHVGRIRRVFRWAATQELLPITVYQSLAALPGLRRGRSDARESEPVGPVPNATVDATLAHMPRIVADMVTLQRLTGCRPGEICVLRPGDIDRSGTIWEFRPSRHKNEHRDRARVILIGPRAQSILSPYLLRAADAFCFAPIETVADTFARRQANRKTPLTCGNRPGTNQVRGKPKRQAGARYSVNAYRTAVQRSANAADRAAHKADRTIPAEQRIIFRWSPNQLRHSAATEIRSRFGLEAAQIILGHAKADVTEIYAERDLRTAAEVVRQIG